ncbi:MAG: hypothetical protein J0H15_02875 [Xanthomonadales bacterium]|nr:hypothetical protein [Xanthomonadales bacterium]
MAEETPSAVAVALLYDAGEGGASTREALAASGASIVYEAESRRFDAAALAGSGASVVVVDLHGSEDEVDGLDELLDRYRVIINDAEVSSALGGWDRARWQRHLCAKILGGGVDPPRPADAEPVPVPVRPRPAAPPLPEASAAATPAEEPWAPEAAPSAQPVGGFEFNLDVAAPDSISPPVAIELPEQPPASLEADLLAALDPFDESVGAASSDVQSLPVEEAPHPVEAIQADALAPEVADTDGDWGLVDFDSLPDAPGFPAGAVDPVDAAAEPALPSTPEWEELAATADSLLLAEADRLEAEAAGDEVTAGAVDAEPEPQDAASIRAPEWSLEDISDELPPAAADPLDFGIETIHAAEFLAPTDDAPAGPAAAHEAFGLELELIPLEEAVAPRQVSDEPLYEARLEHAAAAPRIRQVWVLGASVGGPEAVREFLAALPRDCPALFLLAQHLGGEFVDIMARQLAQATPLTVRTPEHGDRLGHGEVIIVPAERRLRVDPSGTVVLREAAADSAFSPSIDHLLEDVADAFGPAAGAIIFSGMGEDAIEGCRRLAASGGKVWLQDPATCVVATMVEGVQQTGVASFIGSPAQLAEQVQAAAG